MDTRGGRWRWERCLWAVLVVLGTALPGARTWAAVDPPEIEATLQQSRLELHGSVIQLESRSQGQTTAQSSSESSGGFLGLGLGPLFLAGGGRTDIFKQEGQGILERVYGQHNFTVLSLSWPGVFGSDESAVVISAIDAYRRDEYDLRDSSVDFSSRLTTDTDGKYGLSLLFPLMVVGYFRGTEKQRFTAEEPTALPVPVRETYRYPVETAFLGFRRTPERGFGLFLFGLATRGHAARGETVDREASEETLASAALSYRFAGGRRVRLTYNQRFQREAFENVKLTRRRSDTAGFDVQMNESLTVGVSHEVTRERNRILSTFPMTEALKTATTLDVTWSY